MPYASTVAAGSSVSFTVTGEQYVTITTSGNTEGTLQFTPVGGGQNSPINTQTLHKLGPAAVAARQYGPWGLPGTVTVSCQTGSASSITLGMGGSVSPFLLYQSAVPFIILGGDGAAAGMRWSAATDGTFTMTAEPLSGLFSGLTNYMALFYLPASAGGASNTAGWYWGKITAATTGIIYNNTYTSGDPGTQIPASPSAFTSVANGWITQVATEITGLSGITLPGGAMGANGTLEVAWRMHGDTTSTKYFRSKLAGTVWASSQLGANPNSDTILILRNAGVSNKQISSRPSGGPGYNGNTISASEFLALNTAGDLALSESLQFSAANGNYAMIRAAARYVVYPGA
jgi:hypothetical protein